MLRNAVQKQTSPKISNLTINRVFNTDSTTKQSISRIHQYEKAEDSSISIVTIFELII